MTATPFGKEIRRLRREADLTLVDVAHALDCSIAFVSMAERGEKGPFSNEQIRKFCEVIQKPDAALKLRSLVARSTASVKIPVLNKSEADLDFFLTLARKAEDGSITEATIQKMKELLEKPTQE